MPAMNAVEESLHILIVRIYLYLDWIDFKPVGYVLDKHGDAFLFNDNNA